MKVAIIGSAFAGNKGAAAMLESAVHHLTLRHPDVQITHLSMYPRSDARLNPYTNVTVLNARPLRLGVAINGGALVWRVLPFLRRSVRKAVPEVAAIAEADVLLDQGGITFVDGRRKFLIYNVASVLPALMVRTPVVKCAQALGPFHSRSNRFWARRILPRMAAIVSRGAATHQHLVGLGLTNLTAGADMAFTLPVTATDTTAADAAVEPAYFAHGNVVGFSPSAVLAGAAAKRGGNYVRDVAAQIDFITGELGRPVLLIPHSLRLGTSKTHNNDLPVCHAIMAAVARPDLVRFPDGELSSGSLRSLIGRCDLFVASRFHAMVSSLAMGVPTLVIGWSHKYREVLDTVDGAQWATAATDVTDAVFRERIRALAAAKEDVRAAIAAALPSVVARAMAQFDVIDDVANLPRPD